MSAVASRVRTSVVTFSVSATIAAVVGRSTTRRTPRASTSLWCGTTSHPACRRTCPSRPPAQEVPHEKSCIVTKGDYRHQICAEYRVINWFCFKFDQRKCFCDCPECSPISSALFYSKIFIFCWEANEWTRFPLLRLSVMVYSVGIFI